MTFLKKLAISSTSARWCLQTRCVVVGACALMVLSAPASRAFAQQFGQQGDSNDRGWVRKFDSVTVEQVKPGDLPSTVRPGAQTMIRTESDELPKPATQDELKRIVEHIDQRLVQVVSVQTPPRPYRQVPMVHHGHALWISPPEGGEPVLVSPLSWLKEADAVYLMPDEVAKDADADANWNTRRRSLASVTAGNRGEEWLDEHRKELIPVEPHRPDRHRNLVTLVASDQVASDQVASDQVAGDEAKKSKKKSISKPSTGLELFDVENKALFRLYGYTPFFGTSLTQTTMLPTHPEDTALAFYWQTSYPAILGAPLVSQDGKLVAINTFRHPKQEDRFLAIPTGAIASYLTPDEDADQKDDDQKDDDQKDDDQKDDDQKDDK